MKRHPLTTIPQEGEPEATRTPKAADPTNSTPLLCPPDAAALPAADRVPGGPGAGPSARPVPPGQTPPGSRFPEGCRETAGTTAGANRCCRCRDLRSPTGLRLHQPPAKAARAFGCGASDPDGWWRNRGATPGRAHLATQARPDRPAPAQSKTPSPCRLGWARRPLALPRARSAPATPRWDHHRDHQRLESRAPPPAPWCDARPAARPASPRDRRGVRSAAASGCAVPNVPVRASGTSGGGKGCQHSRPACGCRTSAHRWLTPRQADQQRSQSCPATRPTHGSTPGNGGGCRPDRERTDSTTTPC